MSDYTPSEENVRQTFAYIQGGLDHDDGHEPFTQVHLEEFDRFLEATKARARAVGAMAAQEQIQGDTITRVALRDTAMMLAHTRQDAIEAMLPGLLGIRVEGDER